MLFNFSASLPLGRAILPSDTLPGAPPVFVLSYKVWAARFALDRSILGKTFILNDKPTTLIGIMPRRFAFWGGDIWMPATLDRAAPDASTHQFVMYGRLKPGFSVKAAESDTFALLTQLAKIYRGQYPRLCPPTSLPARPFQPPSIFPVSVTPLRGKATWRHPAVKSFPRLECA